MFSTRNYLYVLIISLVVFITANIFETIIDRKTTNPVKLVEKEIVVEYDPLSLEIQKEQIEKLYLKTIIILNDYDEITTIKSTNLQKIISNVYFWSTVKKIDPELILSIIYAESRFNYLETSHAGAVGLMQLIPKYFKESREELFDINLNIKLGIEEFSTYLSQKKNVLFALYRYNGMYKTEYKKTVKVSKESFYYGTIVMDIYYKYKNLIL